MPKQPASPALRPTTPKRKGLNRKLILGATALAAAATVAVFVFDPGLGLGAKRRPDEVVVPSNVKPDLSGLPSDYRETQAASVAVPDAPKVPDPIADLPPPAGFGQPQAQPVGQPFPPAGPAAPRPKKVRRGISVGGDDGLGDYQGRGAGGPMPGVMMAADQGPPGQPR